MTAVMITTLSFLFLFLLLARSIRRRSSVEAVDGEKDRRSSLARNLANNDVELSS